MTTIIQQLEALAEAAPDVCKRNEFNVYQIRQYRFNQLSNGKLHASYISTQFSIYYHADGQAALDLLQGALQRVCEAKGWEPGVIKSRDKGWIAQAANDSGYNVVEGFDTPATALLAALLEAVR